MGLFGGRSVVGDIGRVILLADGCRRPLPWGMVTAGHRL